MLGPFPKEIYSPIPSKIPIIVPCDMCGSIYGFIPRTMPSVIPITITSEIPIYFPSKVFGANGGAISDVMFYVCMNTIPSSKYRAIPNAVPFDFFCIIPGAIPSSILRAMLDYF